MEERLDKVLLQRMLVSSRTRGEELIKNGEVLVNGKTIDKPGKKIPVDAEIQLLTQESPFVSRGALKLLHALDFWNISAEGLKLMDIGASTGGFTQVLLERGAAEVTCIDVGSGQLHEKLRNDPRVKNFEKTHVRELTHRHFPEPVDGAVIDVSFISLEKVIPFLIPFLKPEAFVVALVKPQFEVGRGNVDKHGIVRSAALYPEVIENVSRMAGQSSLEVLGVTDSPIKGGDGNREFLMYLKKN